MVAMQESEAEAIAREGSDIAEAVLRSKADAGPLVGQALVVLRLSRHPSEILAALFEAPELATAFALVEEAGCEVLPEWAQGAVLLAPLTHEQAIEAGLELQAHHIVVAQLEQANVENVLSKIRFRRRPQVRLEDVPFQNLAAASSGDASATECFSVVVNVERTFVNFPAPKAASEISGDAIRSEPWGSLGDGQQRNPHRWRLRDV